MERRRGDWIQTYTLKQFWPMDPHHEDIDIRDIAHALAYQCRFSGHVRSFYSVAEHSVRMSRMWWIAWPGARRLARWALLHDASEAYLVDLPRPLKRLPEFAPYRQAEADIMRVVAARFELDGEEPPEVKEADRRMCYTEARDLFSGTNPAWQWQAEPYPERIEPWSAEAAEGEFLAAFYRLWPRGAQ